jgi:hypothetical protein
MKQPIKATAVGAVTGVAIAGIMIPLVQLGPYSLGPASASVNSFIQSSVFVLCPLFILGFFNDAESMTSLVLITVLGNALLYGTLFGLIAGGGTLVRWLAVHRKPYLSATRANIRSKPGCERPLPASALQ